VYSGSTTNKKEKEQEREREREKEREREREREKERYESLNGVNISHIYRAMNHQRAANCSRRGQLVANNSFSVRRSVA